jgi:hypothetical protein
MPDRHRTTFACLVLALLAAGPVHAQEPSWGLRVFAHGGVNLPQRNLGKNAVEIQQQAALQVVAELESSPKVGGGLEFLFPDRDIRIRGQFMTTVGATASGVLGLCQSGQLAVPDKGLCALDLTTDAKVMDGNAELIFVAGRRDRLIRPTISMGVGIRSFDFESEMLNCDAFGGEVDDAFQVCRRSKEILEEPSVNPTLTFGVGLEAERDQVAAFLRLSAITGSYTGGSGLADGGQQMDLSLTAGLAFAVR